MRFSISAAALLSLCLPLVASKFSQFETQPYTVESLSRQIDLFGSLSQSTATYTLRKTESASSTEDSLPPFKIAIDDMVHGNLSWLEASLGKGSKGQKLDVVKAYHDLVKSATIYNVLVPEKAAGSDNSFVVTVFQVYSHLASPLPKTLEHSSVDGQNLLWQADILGGAGLLGPVKEAKVRVKMPSPKLKRFHTPPGFTSSHTKGSQTIVFSSKSSFNKPSVEIAAVHYFSPEPVVAFRNLKRSVEVSAWSKSLAIEDEMELINNGPALKGHFSRLTHQQQSYQRKGVPPAPHVLSGLSFALPPRVYSPYYYDTVGNVSWSHFRPSFDAKFPAAKGRSESTLELRPRYPLLGGWTYNFTLGYLAPLDDFLTALPGREYELRVPFLSGVKDVPADNVLVRISLPESARILKVVPPFPVESMSEEIFYTYFDTTGRPTVVLKKTACSYMHAKDIVITYHYSVLAHFQKLIVAVSAILTLSASVLLFRRLDWRLQPTRSQLVKKTS